MTEKIDIVIRTFKGHNTLSEMLKCPAHEKSILASNCKHCEHCRIYLGNHVKCSYRDDKENEEKRFVVPVQLI